MTTYAFCRFGSDIYHIRGQLREAAANSASKTFSAVVEQTGVDLVKIRRMGTGAEWAQLVEEKRKQDKLAEEEAAKNAKVPSS